MPMIDRSGYFVVGGISCKTGRQSQEPNALSPCRKKRRQETTNKGGSYNACRLPQFRLGAHEQNRNATDSITKRLTPAWVMALASATANCRRRFASSRSGERTNAVYDSANLPACR